MHSELMHCDDLVYEARLLSGRRPLLIILGYCIALIVTVNFGFSMAIVAALETGVALMAIYFISPVSWVWTEPVSVQITNQQFAVIRPSGRAQCADWSMFDDVRVQPMRGTADVAGHRGSWKLTLMNARKAAISSYINMDADAVLFMMPLELAIDATPEEAVQLQQTLAAMIGTETNSPGVSH